jgi:hypothetical protein
MHRLLIAAILLVTVLSTVFPAAVTKDEPVNVFVYGMEKNLKPAAFLREKKIYVPLRAIASEVGAMVECGKVKNAFMITLGPRKTIVRSTQGIKSGRELMVPVEIISHALTDEVRWDRAERWVRITRPYCPPGCACHGASRR